MLLYTSNFAPRVPFERGNPTSTLPSSRVTSGTPFAVCGLYLPWYVTAFNSLSCSLIDLGSMPASKYFMGLVSRLKSPAGAFATTAALIGLTLTFDSLLLTAVTCF